jgi:hypothetical protein
MTELSITYKIARGHEYVLMIYYEGQITTNQEGKEECDYYNLLVAINQIGYLKNEFACLAENDTTT